MKVAGVPTRDNAIFGPLTFKRGDNFLAFYAQPIWNYDEFHERCPLPRNENVVFTKHGKQTDHDSPDYKVALQHHRRKQWGYLIIKSLEPSNIQWETVRMDDPETWPDVETELRESLGLYEFNAVMALVDEANALDTDKLEENKKSFFLKMGGTEAESIACGPLVSV